ncbi:hypothetical protein ACMU_07380 [Actibacterium mucosum KCTC 23349]|uniref:Uncharacterized protein n=1 Tax=Actibacterium mucosum KCTC 23349 TaxID=1454373 RepID=A0A037ZPJ2_9RHOB|nr:hypothetical protein [Actibacterium mucosum]KAJ56751.1 hypothetical protein ACMU_07380 [Actibacterium mucosum KCTC 23349]
MRFVATSIFLFTAALPVSAEVTGEVRLGVTQAGDISGAAFFADGTWAYEFGAFGVSLGSYGVWTGKDHPHETYAALTYDLGPGKLALGVPRPAYDLFAVSAIDHVLPALGLANVAQTRSHATAVATAGGGVPLGASFASDQFAASVVHIDTTNATVVSVGGRFGNVPLFEGALELVEQSGDSHANAKLGVVHRIDAMTLHATLFHSDVAGQAIELGTSFPVGNNVQLDLFAQVPDEGFDNATVGAAAKFPLGVYSFLNTAVARDTNGEGAYAASIGWRF